jgi:hypothetical protein
MRDLPLIRHSAVAPKGIAGKTLAEGKFQQNAKSHNILVDSWWGVNPIDWQPLTISASPGHGKYFRMACTDQLLDKPQGS